jgi:hypothetical protein
VALVLTDRTGFVSGISYFGATAGRGRMGGGVCGSYGMERHCILQDF